VLSNAYRGIVIIDACRNTPVGSGGAKSADVKGSQQPDPFKAGGDILWCHACVLGGAAYTNGLGIYTQHVLKVCQCLLHL
jgi:hypothetical protein